MTEPDVAALSAVLDSSERDRAVALSHAADRRRYTVAHAAFRIIVAQALGVPAGQVLWLPVRHTGPVGPYVVRDVPAPAGFRAAVALDGSDPFRVVLRRWRQPDTSTAARLRYRSAGS